MVSLNCLSYSLNDSIFPKRVLNLFLSVKYKLYILNRYSFLYICVIYSFPLHSYSVFFYSVFYFSRQLVVKLYWVLSKMLIQPTILLWDYFLLKSVWFNVFKDVMSFWIFTILKRFFNIFFCMVCAWYKYFTYENYT